jgi:GNAT superfamily N-acetyltransferase
VISVRLLGLGDEDMVTHLSLHDPEFDVSPSTAEPLEPLSPSDTAAFLADPNVLYWCAFDGGDVVGHLFCIVHPIRSAPGREVLLYEIGVHHERRREGIGTQLMQALDDWVATNDIRAMWVLADDAEATAFYRSSGWQVASDQPTYLTRDR